MAERLVFTVVIYVSLQMAVTLWESEEIATDIETARPLLTFYRNFTLKYLVDLHLFVGREYRGMNNNTWILLQGSKEDGVEVNTGTTKYEYEHDTKPLIK
jgi:hypothetical protein